MDDIEEAHKSLSEKGVEVGKISEAAGALHAAFCDPDGNEFWLQQKPKG